MPPTYSPRRLPSLRVLFVLRDQVLMDRCLRHLQRLSYLIESEFLAPEPGFVSQVASRSFDVLIAEYPQVDWQGTLLPDFLLHPSSLASVILLVNHIDEDNMAEFLLGGIADCVELDRLEDLPRAMRRAIRERSLRVARDRAEDQLRHYQARYRALASNRAYGIYRCGPDGGFWDVNYALASMLGYSSREELLAAKANTTDSGILNSRNQSLPFLSPSSDEQIGDPVEVEWKRKDGAPIRVRLTAQEILDDCGELEAYEVIVQDITKQRELEDFLRRQAASDPLTGLANYRHMIERLDGELRRSKRTGRQFALLVFDMDGLKEINDRYGHVAGSQALCRMADVLSVCCRDIDTAARFGGDEFALLLPETGTSAAEAAANRICASVAEDSNGPPLSVSVGVGVYPSDGETVELLVSAADSAMYSMKRARHSTRR
jgi:diguanylate cyclase (GGDEF)-like protein/PAS domain S-box-containing protein